MRSRGGTQPTDARVPPVAPLTPPRERPTPPLPAASRIVEDIGDPASSLRAAQDGNTRRLAELQDVGYLLERVRDRNGCSLTHRAAARSS